MESLWNPYEITLTCLVVQEEAPKEPKASHHGGASPGVNQLFSAILLYDLSLYIYVDIYIYMHIIYIYIYYAYIYMHIWWMDG